MVLSSFFQCDSLMWVKPGLRRLGGRGARAGRALGLFAGNAFGCQRLQHFPGSGTALDILFPFAVVPGFVAVAL